jgi:GTP-binding protein
MFIDSVKLTISSGKGGEGSRSFRKEKFAPQGGPDGGDGGRGGDVYFVADNNSHTLANFKGKKHLKAENGENGKAKKAYGKWGEPLVIKVPSGTQIIDNETNKILLDMIEDGEKILFLKGGKGGLGNVHFKSSTNQAPKYAQPGLAGETKNIRLELKLISDVALVGFPNVGKSTLISTVSNAKPEIANYEFTTLTPKLGTVRLNYTDSFVIADIPGIIEGASDGKGLGLEFLNHIERSKVLLFMINISNYRDLETQYKSLREEIKNFSEKLSKQSFGIAITQIDTVSDEVANQKITEFGEFLNIKFSEKTDFKIDSKFKFYERDYLEKLKTPANGIDPSFLIAISSVTQFNIEPLKYLLFDLIKNSN